MASLLEKIRIGVLAAAHDLLDQVIDLNSAGAVRQYIRDLEGAKSKMEEATAEAGADVRGLKRGQTQLTARVNELNTNIDLVLSDADETNDHLATPLEARLIGLEADLASKNAEVEASELVYQQLTAATANVEVKLISMRSQLQRIDAMEREAAAKERAAETLNKVHDLTATGADATVDSVTERLQRRKDVADEKFGRAMEGVTTTLEKDITLSAANDRIAARKARIAAEHAGK